MNRDEKAAVIEEVAGQIQAAEAVFAVDYRGISVTQAAELRAKLDDAGATFRVVKNRLTQRAADQAGAETLKEYLEGPTAFTFVSGDVAVAAKALAQFRREHDLLEFKGGTMEGEPLTADEILSISRLPALDVLHGQFVGVLASPITTLVRGLNSMISGLAVQLQQIADQGLVSGEAPAADTSDEAEAPADTSEDASPPAEETAAGEEEAPAAEAEAEASADTPDEASGDSPEQEWEEAPVEEAATEDAEAATPSDEAPGDPVAEGETAEEETSEQAPSEGDQEKEG